MDKPKKKKPYCEVPWESYDDGYNDACDDWEKYHEKRTLAISKTYHEELNKVFRSLRLSEEEVEKCLHKVVLDKDNLKWRYSNTFSLTVNDVRKVVARAIVSLQGDKE